jgi:hypothetical protein
LLREEKSNGMMRGLSRAAGVKCSLLWFFGNSTKQGSEPVEKDPLKKWEKVKPGSIPADKKEAVEILADAPPKKLKPREYKAFTSAGGRTPMLLIKTGTRKQPVPDEAFSYTYLTNVVSSGYGFSFSLHYSLPQPCGPVIIQIRGEGLTALLDGILEGTVKSLELFDPDRFLPTKAGDWDIEAHEWRGPCVIKHISITTKNSPHEDTTKH